MEPMSITSDARANRATRALRRQLRSTLTAGLIISTLIGGSGRVASAQSAPIVTDPLTDPSTGWPQDQQPGRPGTDTSTEAYYGDDGYHIAVHQDVVPGTVSPVPFTGSWSVGNPTLNATLQAGGVGANQSIEVDATQVDGGPNNAYGVACRITENGGNLVGYILWVGSGGTAGIYKSDPGQTTELAHSNNVAAANSYHLRADCNGSRLAVFVNGTKVAEAQDSDYKSGQVGLFVYTMEASGIDVAFTNLSISRP